MLDGVAGPLSDTQGKYLAYARGACRQLQRSVEAMLLNGQLEAGSPSRKQWCDLEALIEQTVEGFELDARARQVNVGYAIEGVLPQVRLDPHEFKQVLSALMNHALNARHENGSVLVTADFTRKGTDSVTINVSASLSLLPSTGEPAAPNPLFSEIFCKGPYVIETRFNDGLQFSFDVPINGYSK